MKTSGQKMQLFRWFVDLQRQRNRLQDEMTEHFVGNSENARESFGKAAKAMRALPLAKLRVGHILVDRTLLKFLLLELQKAGEHIFDFEIPLLSPVIVGLDDKGEHLKKRAKLNDNGTQKRTRAGGSFLKPTKELLGSTPVLYMCVFLVLRLFRRSVLLWRRGNASCNTSRRDSCTRRKDRRC